MAENPFARFATTAENPFAKFAQAATPEEQQPVYADIPYTSAPVVPTTRERPLSELSAREMIMGAIETPVALAATIAGAPLSILTSRATPEVKAAVRPFQYEPKSELAQRAISGLGSMMSGLPPYIPSTGAVPAVANQMALARQARQGAVTEQQANELLRRAVRDETLRAGAQEGLVVTPGAVSPTGANIYLERLAGKTRLEQTASVRNQEMADAIARREAGLPDTAPLTSEAMQKIRKDEYAKGYEPLAAVGKVATDDTYLKDLTAIESKYAGPSASFPGAVPENVGKLIETYTVGDFDAKDAIKVMRTLRAQSQANFKKGDNDLALAQRDIASAMESQLARAIETSGRGDADALLAQFQASRKRMAISHAIEDAIREGTGSVDANKFARALQKGEYLSGGLKTLGEFANAFPRVTQPASQIGAPGAATLLGAINAAPQLISEGVRNYLLSPVGQRRTIPRYSREAEIIARDIEARNALLQQAAPVDNALAR
jgi:hypothetical protein